MKLINKLCGDVIRFGMPLSLLLTGCTADLTDTNLNPNALSDQQIKPAYVMTSVISGSALKVAEVSITSNVTMCVIPEAMQYTQRDFLEFAVTNTFGWSQLSWSTRDLYKPLSNARYLEQRATGDADSSFIKGVALAMQSYWFGFNTSAWGDVPYSQAMQGAENNLQPVYDKQADVFKGILGDLEAANEYFTAATNTSSITMKADVLFAGDALRWRKFVNSLHLRFLMRLSEKATEMKALGVDVVAEFSKIVADPAKYPLILSSADNAAVAFPGNNATDSWPLGALNTPTTSEFYRKKPAATIVNFLKTHNDPRLTVWFMPTDVQTLVRDKGADVVIMKDENGVVKRYIKTYNPSIDTSLYVGLKIGLNDPDSYNNNKATYLAEAAALNSAMYKSGAANPFVSYLSTMYRQDKNPLVKSIFITAAEVQFTLAEAAVRGWIPAAALDYYLNGVTASLEQYGIKDGDVKVYNPTTHKTDAFDKSAFLASLTTEYNNAANKTEAILTQKWAAAFTTVDGWFDWRRTGFPAIGKNISNGPQGEKIPVRFMYGDNEINYNGQNANAAISSLTPAANDQWSKMWLIEGTGKPW
ncbi:SusD/RagB family nutrient-binding outer membrane lipoprotein [Chitinophaga sp. MM2321]|uniref:SusD/RagB family nutrient-binding outer membrane lipoprotein n=1 Tax=Chitinophaga sp. MM2321 TaxID=3137178 RepID=UPI0032D579CF